MKNMKNKTIGFIAALLLGVITLCAAAVFAVTEWGGDLKTRQNKITIGEIEDAGTELSQTALTLYIYNGGGKYTQFPVTNNELSLSVEYEGEPVADPEVAWSSDDPSVTVNSSTGALTAVSAGEAIISATWISPNSKEYVKTCLVTVRIPTIELTASAVGVNDIYIDPADGNKVINVSEAYGISESFNFEMYDSLTNTQIPFEASGFAWTLAIGNALCGERTVELRAAGIVTFKAPLVVITKKLTTAAQLSNLMQFGELVDRHTVIAPTGQWDLNRPYYKHVAYFILGNSIDMTGITVTTMFARSQTPNPFDEYGLTGGIDGRGHTVYGGTYGGNGAAERGGTLQQDGYTVAGGTPDANAALTAGLVGMVASTAVIRNIAFVNPVISGNFGGIFGIRVSGRIDNVLIDIANVMSNWHGALAESVIGATITNSVFYYPTPSSGSNNAALAPGFSNNTVTNCYVISDMDNALSGSGSTVIGGGRYAAGTAAGSIPFSGLKEWFSASGAKVTFAGAKTIAQGKLNALDLSGSGVLNSGQVITLPELPIGAQWVPTGFSSGGSPAYVGIAGNSLSIGADIDDDFAFTLKAVWNGDAGVSVSKPYTVTKIVSILLQETYSYQLYTGLTGANARIENEAPLTFDLSGVLSGAGDEEIPASDLVWTLRPKAGGNTVDITSVISITSGNKITSQTKPAYGQYELAGQNESFYIRLNVDIVTMSFGQAEAELLAKKLQYFGDGNIKIKSTSTWGGDSYVFDYKGYFTLYEDIDFGDMIIDHFGTNNSDFTNRAAALIGDPERDKGFHGIFDGKGHTLLNGMYWGGGLFGHIAPDAVIRNLAVVDADIDFVYAATIIAARISAGASLNNILIDVAEMRITSSTGDSNNGNYRGMTGYSNQGTWTNTIFYFGAGGPTGAENGVLATMAYEASMSGNVYMFTDQTQTSASAPNYDLGVYTGRNPIAVAGRMRALDGVLTESEQNAFDSAIWDFTGNRARFVTAD